MSVPILVEPVEPFPSTLEAPDFPRASATETETAFLETVINRCEQMFRADYKFYMGLGGNENPAAATCIAELYMSAIGGRIEVSASDDDLESDLLGHLQDEGAPPSILILGDSGTGKTSLALTLTRAVWNARRVTKSETLPLYINLPAIVALNSNLDKIVETYLRARDVSSTCLSDYIRMLKTQNLLIVLDSYDEVSRTGTNHDACSQNLWDANGWNDTIPGSIRTVTFCRPAVLSSSTRERRVLFETVIQGDTRPGFQEFYLQKYTQAQFEHYVNSFVKFVRESVGFLDRGTWWRNVRLSFVKLQWMDPAKEYNDWFTKMPDLRSLAALTPFMLFMIMRALPGMILHYKNDPDCQDQLRRICSTKTGVFDEVTSQWFEYQAKRDKKKFQIKAKINAHTSTSTREAGPTASAIDLASLQGYYRAYAQNLAQAQFDTRTGLLKDGQLSDADTLRRDLAEPGQNLQLLALYLNDPIHSNLFPMTLFSTGVYDEQGVIPETAAELERKMSNLRLLRDGCLIESHGEARFRFSHRSLLEYFAARHVFDTVQSVFDYYVDGIVGQGVLLPGKAQGALARDLLKEHEVLVQLAERVHMDDHFSEVLGTIVLKSATHTTIATMASNAITILNFAGVSFSGQDFRNINVQGANLSGAILGHTDLRSACLRETNLQYSYLNSARLEGANLLDTDMGPRRQSRIASTIANICDTLTYSDALGRNLAWVSFVDGTLSNWSLETLQKISTLRFCPGMKCQTGFRGYTEHKKIELNRLSVDKFTVHSACSWANGIQVRWLQSGDLVPGWPGMPVKVELEDGPDGLDTHFNLTTVEVTCATAQPPAGDHILLWGSKLVGSVLQFFRSSAPSQRMHVLPYELGAARFHPTYPDLILLYPKYPVGDYMFSLYEVGEWIEPLATIPSLTRFHFNSFEFHPDGTALVVSSMLSSVLRVYSVAIHTDIAENKSGRIAGATMSNLRNVNTKKNNPEFQFSPTGTFLLTEAAEYLSVLRLPDFDCIKNLAATVQQTGRLNRISVDGSLLLGSRSNELSVHEIKSEGARALPPPPQVPSILQEEHTVFVFAGIGASCLVVFCSPRATRVLSFDSNWGLDFTSVSVDLLEAGVGRVLACAQLPVSNTGTASMPVSSRLLVVGSEAIGLLRIEPDVLEQFAVEDVCEAEACDNLTDCMHNTHAVVCPEHGFIVFSNSMGNTIHIHRFWVTEADGAGGACEDCSIPRPRRKLVLGGLQELIWSPHIRGFGLSFPASANESSQAMVGYHHNFAYILVVVMNDDDYSDAVRIYRIDSTKSGQSPCQAPEVHKVGHVNLSNPRFDLTSDKSIRMRPVLDGTSDLGNDWIGLEIADANDGGGSEGGRVGRIFKSYALTSKRTLEVRPRAYESRLGLLAICDIETKACIVSVYEIANPNSHFRLKCKIKAWFDIHSITFKLLPEPAKFAHLIVAGSRDNLIGIEIDTATDSGDKWKIIWSLQHCSHLMVDHDTRIAQTLMPSDTADQFGRRGHAEMPETRLSCQRFIPLCSLISEITGTATSSNTEFAMRPKVRVLGRNFLISPDAWVVSVAIEKEPPTPGRFGCQWNPLFWFDLVHSFIVLEGMWPGRGPRQFIMRAELGQFPHTKQGFVRTKGLDDLERLAQDVAKYKAQQWNISREAGLQLLANIQTDQQRYIKFSKLKRNCAKWCMDQLSGIGIKTKRAWYNFVLVTPGQMLP